MATDFKELSPLGKEARLLSVQTSAIAQHGPNTTTHHLGQSIKTLHQLNERAEKLQGSRLSATVKEEIRKAKSDISKTIDNLSHGKHKTIKLLDPDDDSTGLAAKINKAFNALTKLIGDLHTKTQESLSELVSTQAK